MEADRRGLLTLVDRHEELLVCTSFSKNFGLYSERVGALMVVAAAAETTDIVRSNVKRLIRANYSNPPRHGAAIVAAILEDPDLRRRWESELAGMRQVYIVGSGRINVAGITPDNLDVVARAICEALTI